MIVCWAKIHPMRSEMIVVLCCKTRKTTHKQQTLRIPPLKMNDSVESGSLKSAFSVCIFGNMRVRTLSGHMQGRVLACNDWSQPFLATRMQGRVFACNERSQPLIANRMQGHVLACNDW